MTAQFFATKKMMGQTWTKSGKRMPFTRLQVEPNVVISAPSSEAAQITPNYHLGYGKKKLKNMSKPLRTILEKSGFSFGVRQIKQVTLPAELNLQAGQTLAVDQVVKVGDVVKVQGVTKGRGFAGVVKRHGFAGGPKTHGQSDRLRAPGSIGAGTTPGRVYKGKRMAGHYGVENLTITNLTILHVDAQKGEVWVGGPVPGHLNSIVRLTVTDHIGFEGLNEAVAPKMTPVVNEATAEVEGEKAEVIEETVAEEVKDEVAETEVSVEETAEVKE